jgi:hypothetical protein
MVKSENASQRGNPARVAAELRSDADGGGIMWAYMNATLLSECSDRSGMTGGCSLISGLLEEH